MTSTTYTDSTVCQRRSRTLTCVFIAVGIGLVVVILTSIETRWQHGSPRHSYPLYAPPEEAEPASASVQSPPGTLSAFLAEHPDLPSRRWAPVSVSTCQPGMASHLGPCLAQRRQSAIFGEELMYPDFRLREPLFAQGRLGEDTPRWRRLLDDIRDRAAPCMDGTWVCYRGQAGQNIVLANATYFTSPPPDRWSELACMGAGVTSAGLRTAPANASANTLPTRAEYDRAFPADALLVATAPDSWSFQHFLDRVTRAPRARARAPEAVTGRPPARAVEEMWTMLGLDEGRVHFGEDVVAAKAVIFSCRAPLVHPWLSMRTLETFGLDPRGEPLSQRKKVVYFSRSHNDTHNEGRKVVNEGELLDGIRQLLAERGQGEELVLYHEMEWPSQRELTSWFHKNVRAVIGPHGGALYNHRWTGRDTLVLELASTAYSSLMFWEEASILGQVYATMLLPPVGDSESGTDMQADVPAVLEIIRTHIGTPDSRGRSLRRAYAWHAEELQVEE
ncbi:hypothetical protein BD413DRAFT_605985 [Trametes elegans]|nr:hypothetical protein BD413DRAFT_605985 [Trametes elegans]